MGNIQPKRKGNAAGAAFPSTSTSGTDAPPNSKGFMLFTQALLRLARSLHQRVMMKSLHQFSKSLTPHMHTPLSQTVIASPERNTFILPFERIHQVPTPEARETAGATSGRGGAGGAGRAGLTCHLLCWLISVK